MRWSLRVLCLSTAITLAATPSSSAAQSERGMLDAVTARALVDELTELVESQSLGPRDPAEYELAKRRLHERLKPEGARVDRKGLYTTARALLGTLDTDGHSLLLSRQQMQTWGSSTQPAAASRAAVASVLNTNAGAVLVVRPPQATFTDLKPTLEYARLLRQQIAGEMARKPPCALVVNLTDQRGGNAWPVLAAFSGLFTDKNLAKTVDRNGVRKPVVDVGYLDKISPQAESALQVFAGQPFAVVMGPRTASSGEMLAVALRGEPAARWFGRPSFGATTINKNPMLADGAILLLTYARYALGDADAIRGKLLPDVAADSDDPEAAVSMAASWVTAHAPACRAH